MLLERKILTKIKNKKSSYIREKLLILVLGEGLEPSRPEGHRILSPVRLPIPPSEQEFKIKNNFIFKKIFFSDFKNLGKNFIINLWRVS